MSTEAVETSPQVKSYSYYNSDDKKALGSISSEDFETAKAAITKVLKSVAAQNCLPNLIEGPSLLPEEGDWTISLAPPPDVANSSLSKCAKEVDALDLAELKIDSKILDEYSSAKSPTYKQHRLLEIICAAIHHLAIDLYTKSFAMPESADLDTFLPRPYPVIAHYQYYASKPWKNVFDLKAVGFWAEAQIFGGVLYFDRSHDEDEDSYQGVWLHGLPHAYTESLWRVPDDVLVKAVESAALPLDVEAAQDTHLLGLLEAQDEHFIYREVGLVNKEAYEGEYNDAVIGLSDEDLKEIQELRAKRVQEEAEKAA
ncbi:hypothetical protein ABW20_dc0100334 [Dactylellina cionopaga]|nr:hypothetical protein ABW20_dc0100334 [Dactylellina cionopaga]